MAPEKRHIHGDTAQENKNKKKHKEKKPREALFLWEAPLPKQHHNDIYVNDVHNL